MDFDSYQSLMLKTKDSLDTRVCRKAFLPTHFSSVLIECNNCISLSLNLVTNILEGSISQVSKLCGFIEDTIIVVQMLSDFIKYVIETVAMSCCSMKPFPVTTGNIILTVFMHCKDSEHIYGSNLKSVETQLKQLFRTCHELQLTYLMTLEKHFIFDLTEREEQEILIEALNINMRIGEIVQALDIKTMAEQWKAYTVICEKYSNFLQEHNIYNKCIQLFSFIIIDNIKIALEPEQDSKTLIRSLKIANFTIKIFLRLSNVFKHSTSNNYEKVVELLQYIYIYNPAYLEQIIGKQDAKIDLFATNVLSPTDSLCNILLQDERFLNCIQCTNVKKLQQDEFLGYIILVITLMKLMLERKDQKRLILIDCIYNILPLGHYWFNVKLRFHIKDSRGFIRSFGLYEYLLVHTVAFVCTLNPEQYEVLERYMYEAILSTECYKAVFSSNLWVIVARIFNESLGLETLSLLTDAYQKLEKLVSFKNSPQDIYLRHTISNLFRILLDEDKAITFKKYEPHYSIWSVFRVCNLPDQLRMNTEAIVIRNVKKSINFCFESTADVKEKDVAELIQNLNVAATCLLTDYSDEVEQYLVKLWLKACHKNKYINLGDTITSETEWFYEYLDALVNITGNQYKYSSSSNLGKILHVITTILDSCNMEIIIMMFNLYCTLTFEQRDENQHVIESMFKSTLKHMLQNVESATRTFILENLIKYSKYERFHELTSEVFQENEYLRNEWRSHCHIECNPNSEECKELLIKSRYYEFTHKCLRADSCTETIGKIKSTESNFFLGDFFFDDTEDSEVEPSRKKAKLCSNELESVIERLENDTELLTHVEIKLSNNHKKRIDSVIQKLKNILS